jgi:hypothetical protein
LADAPEVKVRLTAEDTGVAAAIKELGAQLKNLKTQQDDTAGSSLRLGSALKGIAFGAAAYGVAAFVKSVFDAGTQIARTAQITGASAQTIGVFHKAAGDLGIDAELVDTSFVRLSRSILNFQNGNTQTVAAFRQLGISAKDFVGLSTDQKIKLVTDRLGSMAEGTNRAALAQQLLGRSGAEVLPVLSQLAGKGFGEVEARAKSMGLLLDNQTANSILQMKGQIEDLKDEATGAATQFEAGLIPAITNVSTAMLQAINGSGAGSGFKSLGEEVGSLVEKVAYGLVTTGQRVAEAIAIMESAWDYAVGHMKESAVVLGAALTGNIIGAFQAMKELGTTNAGKDLAAQIAAIEKQFKEENDKSNLDIFGGASNAPPIKPPAGKDGPGGSKVAKAAPDAANRAQLALTEKKLEDEQELFKAYFAKRAEEDKAEYDRGAISLETYFARRRADIASEAAEEITILQQQRDDVQAAADKAAKSALKQPDKSSARDKLNAESLTDLAKVDELNTKIALAQDAASTKQGALDAEEFEKKKENQQQVLEFHKQLEQLQGKEQEVSKSDIALEAQKHRIQLEQAGESKEQIDAELAQFTQLKTAQADFEAARKKTQQDQKAFELEKQGLQIKGKAGQLSPIETERAINQLIRDRLPLLQADADAEIGAAQKTGKKDAIAAANDDKQKIQDITVSAKDLGLQMGQNLNASFTNFFETVGRGTQGVARQFENLAASVVQSIEQMLIKLLLLKIAKEAAGATGGGTGFFGSLLTGLGGGHKEGGLIKGPGGPKDDAIPARLSAGEFVVKADAVSAFGAHNLEAINRGMKIPAMANLAMPKFADGGLVGPAGGSGSPGQVNMGITLDKGLILHYLSSKDAGRIVLNHLTQNPKAASKALGRSQG